MGNDMSIPAPLPSQDHPSITGLVGQIPRDDLNKKDLMGWTPLHVACWANNVSAVNDLLSIPEVEVNERDVNDDTAVMVAAAYCCKEALQAMLMDRRVELDEEGLTEEYRLEEIAGNVQGSSESKRTIRKAIRDERRNRYNCLQTHNCQQCQNGVGVACGQSHGRQQPGHQQRNNRENADHQQRNSRESSEHQQRNRREEADSQQSHIRLGAASHQSLESLGAPFLQRPTRPYRRSAAENVRTSTGDHRTPLVVKNDTHYTTTTPVVVNDSKTITGSVATFRNQRKVTPRRWCYAQEGEPCKERSSEAQHEAPVEDKDKLEDMRSSVRQQYIHKIEEIKLKIKGIQESGQDEGQDKEEKLRTMIGKLTLDLSNLETENGTPETDQHMGGNKGEKGGLGAAQQELECPVCLNLMKPPTRIWMCSSSHLICQLCKEMMRGNLCPTCRTVQVSMRALFAEHMAATLFAANLDLELD